MYQRTLPCLALSALFLVAPLAAAAGETGGAAHGLGHTLERLRRLEVVEMVAAILSGSPLGPGAGWFHPGQSRYGWDWLAARHGVGRDGSVAPDQFRGPDDVFARLDRTRDGVLSAADFDWSDRSPLLRDAAPAAQWARLMDRDSNGRVSRAEWLALFDRVAQGKGYLTADDLREALPLAPRRPAASAGPPRDAPTPGMLLRGLLDGEIGSFLEGPDVNALAPGFTLPTHDGKQQVALRHFRGVKPVVLIFGSFT